MAAKVCWSPVLRVSACALLSLFALARQARAQTPTPTPAPQSSPTPADVVLPAVAGAWDSQPHTLSTSRNLKTAYGLYGRGMDALFGPLATRRGATGILVRLARAPLDGYVAWLTTLAGHELGHCQQAWLAGSEDCHWVTAPGPYALGHIVNVGDIGRLSPAERQAVVAGGTEASVAGADALGREIIARGSVTWTDESLLIFRQLDLVLYGLTSPAPAEASPAHYANDITNYSSRYGVRSGRGPDTVHHAIVRGSIWSLADPMMWQAGFQYASGYIVQGSRTQRPLGIEVHGLTWMAATHAWLSEVGVRYAVTVLSRTGGGDAINVTPSWGEGQPAVDGQWSHALREGLRVSVAADFWRQRESAAPGPVRSGGLIDLGASRRVGKFTIVGDAGYKTAGVALARPHAAGWFFSIGSGVWLGSPPR